MKLWRSWADLTAKAQEHGVESPTFAMSDVFESRAVDLEAYGGALAPEIGQVGANLAQTARRKGFATGSAD